MKAAEKARVNFILRILVWSECSKFFHFIYMQTTLHRNSPFCVELTQKINVTVACGGGACHIKMRGFFLVLRTTERTKMPMLAYYCQDRHN